MKENGLKIYIERYSVECPKCFNWNSASGDGDPYVDVIPDEEPFPITCDSCGWKILINHSEIKPTIKNVGYFCQCCKKAVEQNQPGRLNLLEYKSYNAD